MPCHTSTIPRNGWYFNFIHSRFLFFALTQSSPSPTHYAILAMVDVVHRVWGEPRVASPPSPEVGDRRWVGGVRTSCLVRWTPPLLDWFGFTRVSSFSQNHCHPLFYIPLPFKWSEWACRVLIQQKQKQSFIQALFIARNWPVAVRTFPLLARVCEHFISCKVD